ncbi:unnamed protein product [Cladocopium goreaui]|uniref:Peridinin-chlorophyll a-binding protein, chloroplastic n=1 Tax=Cladocopium goreaui TaxID=2562237 RepID=A0A9P1FV57_9DINO|nr:unnamed protein product [Cladocopium goreaui]
MPAMASCGTLHSQTSACGPAAFPQQSVSSCQVEGFIEPPNYKRGNSTASQLTGSSAAEGFPVGCCVTALDEMVMRAEEVLKSAQVAVIEEGSLLDVLAHGGEPGTRRLYVRQPESGLCGWISCVAQSGRALVSVAAAQAPPVAAVASTATRRSQMLSGVSQAFDPQEAEVERVRTVQTQRSAAGTTATTVTTSYPAQQITEDPMQGKQWLRRQKAQDLREEAPKRFLVDNRMLNAATDGIGYRFSKDLEDLDLSCTAPWGSIVEGVDEGSWIRVSDELYLPKELGGVPVLTLEDTPFALSGLQVNEAFPIGSELIVLEAAIMRAAEELRSAALAQLEKDRRLQVLGYGTGIRSRRLYVQDPMSGQDGWISFASQNGKLLVAPTEATADEVQKVATMATRVAMPMEQFQEEQMQQPEVEQAYFVDNREFKADSDGIGYRASQDLDDKAVPARTALWGSVVHGVDVGDGWCRVGAYYLPMSLTGLRVLTPKEEVSASLLPKLAGFARGDWEYICVDPQGVVTHLEPEEAESKPTGQVRRLEAGTRCSCTM